MFTHDIVPIAKIAIGHSEFHTLDYLLFELSGWMQGPDKPTTKDALTIASLLIDAMEKDPSLKSRYMIWIHRIHKYAKDTLEYLGYV